MTAHNNPGQSELLDPPTVHDISTFDKVLEIEREIAVRSKVFPRMIAKGKLSHQQAAKRLLILEAMLSDYNEIMAIEVDRQRPMPHPM